MPSPFDNADGRVGSEPMSTSEPIPTVTEILRFEDLPPGSLRDKAVACNGIYAALLEQIQTAFDGHPEALTRAVGTMFDLKNASVDLLRVPLPGEAQLHAGPTFQYGDSAGA